MTTITASHFAYAHAARRPDRADWRAMTLDCVEQLGAAGEPSDLGFVYVTDALADNLSQIVPLLRDATGIDTWIGSAAIGVAATGVEYFDQPAIVTMTASLPESAWRLIPILSGAPALAGLRDWAAQSGGNAAPLGIVHADPRKSDIAEIISDLASGLSGFLVGGLASSQTAPDQVAGAVVRGGISGVLLAPNVAVSTALTQGCTPVGPTHTVTAAKQNVMFELDGRLALEVFKEDIGAVPGQRLDRAALARQAGAMHAAFPVAGSDRSDYLVRNLIGIDPERGWLAVGDTVAVGDKVLFVRRDRAAAEQDLVAMLRRLKRGNATPRAGLYFTCLARGPNLFGPDSAELAIVRRELGDFPLVGMFCNGEIFNNRLYGYTGVLTLFL